MPLYFLRGAFILLAASVAALYLLSNQEDQAISFFQVSLMLILTLGVACLVVAVDVFARQKKLSALSGVFLGILGGLLAAYAMSFVVDLIALLTAPEIHFESPKTRAQYDALTDTQRGDLARRTSYLNLLEGVKVFIGLVTCYVGISLVMQTKDDFRFVLPYVEFAKQIRGLRPTLLDTSVIIDGRIVDIINTHIAQGALVVPKFVLNELQLVADSADRLRRARGRRGLDILQQLQRDAKSEVVIADDEEVEGSTTDQKLVSLAQTMRARIMTNDYNLSKIAELRGVDVINLNELAKALRPVVLPGENMTVRVIKAGENPSQGVGYLEDGTMVVIENARHLIGEDVELAVTSTLQTSAGRMIFGRNADDPGFEEGRGKSDPNRDRTPRPVGSRARSRPPGRSDSTPPPDGES